MEKEPKKQQNPYKRAANKLAKEVGTTAAKLSEAQKKEVNKIVQTKKQNDLLAFLRRKTFSFYKAKQNKKNSCL